MFFFSSCDSVEKLKSKCPMLEQEIRDSSRFKDFYQFTFNYAKNPGQKGLGEFIQHISTKPNTLREWKL